MSDYTLSLYTVERKREIEGEAKKEFGRVSSPVKLKDGVRQTAKWFKLID